MRTFDTPYDTAFWRSQPKITSYLFLIKNNLSSTTQSTSRMYAKIFEYELGNENGYITTELTSEIKAFLLNANGARFCVFHGAQKYGEVDGAAWYTPAYFINNTDIFDNRTKVKFYGSPLPQIADWSSPISVSATDPFTTVFDNLLAGASSSYKPDGFTKETRSFQYWHTYNMETSGNISMYDMNDFVSLLKRKYLVQAFARSYDGANHKVLFQNIKKNPTATGFDYIGKLQLISDTSNRNIRLFYTDETGLVTDSGYGTKSHNLGFIPSTANASELNLMTGIQKPIFRITECFDPRHENGDLLEITTLGIQDSPTSTIGAIITVTERFKNGEYLETIIETPTFPDGIGASGAVKSNSKNTGIASVLDTSQFGSILNTTDNTLQKALDKLDDHDHSGLATTEGIQDIIGAMVSSNTETGIAVTYDDTNGKLDFAVDQTGWITGTGTWSYSSADSPTFVISINADVTGILQAGMRVKLTQTTAKYFLITAVGSYSGGATLVTVYGGTDYTLANAAISTPFYSNIKCPFGFPMDPAKWTVSASNTGRCQKVTPTASTWYGDTGLSATGPSISVPIGAWRGFMKAVLQTSDTTVTDYNCYMTLSTANNTESDTDNTVFVAITVPSGTYKLFNIGAISLKIAVASKTTYYLNIKTSTSTADIIEVRGDVVPSIIKLVSDYL